MTSCQFTAKLGGVVDFVVSAATAGHTTPENSSVIDGKTYTYYAQAYDTAVPQNITGWEAGSGTYTISTHKLKRTTITANSDGTTIPVNFLLPPVVDVYASPAGSLEPPATPFVPLAGGTMTGGLIVPTVTVTPSDIWSYRTGGTTGVIYLSNTGTRYLYWDGSNYNIPGGHVLAGNGQLWGHSDFSSQPIQNARLANAGAYEYAANGPMIEPFGGSAMTGSTGVNSGTLNIDFQHRYLQVQGGVDGVWYTASYV